MAPALRKVYDQMPEPKYVISMVKRKEKKNNNKSCSELFLNHFICTGLLRQRRRLLPLFLLCRARLRQVNKRRDSRGGNKQTNKQPKQFEKLESSLLIFGFPAALQLPRSLFSHSPSSEVPFFQGFVVWLPSTAKEN